MNFIYLFIAIVAEVIGTTALKASDGFTRLQPTAITLLGFAVALFFLSLALKTIPVGIAYAIWSGVGIVVISAVAYVHFGQLLDPPAVIGIGLILLGVVIINVFSNSIPH